MLLSNCHAWRHNWRERIYGFCFRKWRSMTLPNGPGFCFQKWRSVRYPDFWLFSTLTFNIVTWWRHTCDVTPCTYTLTDTLSATYDVTTQSLCVMSQVTKMSFGCRVREWRWEIFSKCCQYGSKGFISVTHRRSELYWERSVPPPWVTEIKHV